MYSCRPDCVGERRKSENEVLLVLDWKPNTPLILYAAITITITFVLQ